MANIFQAIGQANPAKQIMGTISAIQGLQLQQRQALTQMQMSKIAQSMQQRDKIFKQKQQEYADSLKPISFDTIGQHMVGGINGPVAKETLNVARQFGLATQTPYGWTIKKRDVAKLKDAIKNDPATLTRINGQRISYLRNQLSSVDELLQKKPGDEKMMAQQKALTDQLNRAIYQDEPARRQMKVKTAQQAAIAKLIYDEKMARQKHEWALQEKYNYRNTKEGVEKLIEGKKDVAKINHPAKQPLTPFQAWWLKHKNEPHAISRWIEMSRKNPGADLKLISRAVEATLAQVGVNDAGFLKAAQKVYNTYKALAKKEKKSNGEKSESVSVKSILDKIGVVPKNETQ